MKHDFRLQPTGDAAQKFLEWLESETAASLRCARGDGDQTKAVIFIYANRACESHMTSEQIGELFGRCVIDAGYQEDPEIDAACAWLDHSVQIAAKVFA